MKEKILLGMSGGKDSTWSCRILQDMGYEVEGIFLSLTDSVGKEKAVDSANRLGIKLHIADYSELFEREVKDFFKSEYTSGRTPNPCVECNKKIKFHAMTREADKLGIEKIATGHYVRVLSGNSRIALQIPADDKKDQSYFLWQLDQATLSRFVAPLSEVKKEEVVEGVLGERLADAIEESQDVCFIENGDYVSFLKNALDENSLKKAFRKGNFVSADKRILGEHQGCASYTVGQRKGLGIALGRPAFVTDIDIERCEVTLGFEEDNKTRHFSADSLNFVSVDEFEGETDAFVRPRFRSPLIKVRVRIKEGRAEVESGNDMKLVSSGQSAVFYDEDGRLLFGGRIIKG